MAHHPSGRLCGLLILGLLPGADGDWVGGAAEVHRFTGDARWDEFGHAMADAGDVDGDGVHDLVVGAPRSAAGGDDAGRAYVFSGRTGARLHTFTGNRGDQLGWAVAGAGDVDGDGRDDLLVGAPQSTAGTGRAYVFSGRDGRRLLTLPGQETRARFGAGVAGLGDVDGDGFPDVAIGEPSSDDQGQDTGRVTVVSGRSGVGLTTLAGERPGELFGSALAGASWDGVPTLVVGAPGAGDRRGGASVFRGEALELAFRIEPVETSVSLGERCVTFVGDHDADGLPDVAVGDWKDRASGSVSTGRLLVHSLANGRRLLNIAGHQPGEGFGVSCASAGDLDGDGVDELLVGSWLSSEGATRGGKLSLLAGADGSQLSSWLPDEAGAAYGFELAHVAGDDGGARRFAVSAVLDSTRGPSTGRVELLELRALAKTRSLSKTRSPSKTRSIGE